MSVKINSEIGRHTSFRSICVMGASANSLEEARARLKRIKRSTGVQKAEEAIAPQRKAEANALAVQQKADAATKTDQAKSHHKRI